ncbi:hypothetical protein ACR77V_13310 [Staphylococcus epidermidis]|uniref:hypothetical protein n=1 Tax=Staphylococcus epidermidis TaxID=1282 RepID=UPI003DA4B298
MTIKAYLIQTGILALVFFAVFYSIRLYTFNEVRKQYNQTIERLELEQLQNLQQLQSQQNIVVSGYLQKIKTLEGEHEKTLQELETAQFSNTVTGVNCVVSNAVNSLHKDGGSQTTVQTTGNKPDLICYTRAELQRKVKESLALTREADELAIKYRALLEVCTQKDK